jgi:uncharacterized SAM-binding protein YcdF (DUF218 family)
MFFLSKTLGWLATPTNLMISLAALGLVLLLTRFAVTGRRLLAVAAALLVIFAFSPLGYWLMVPLEQRFPVYTANDRPAGIIVLGGSIAPDLSRARGMGVFPYSADRLVAAAELARRFPDVPVIFTGGSATLALGDGREADFADEIFQRLGLDKGRVTLERESRNTIENARFVKIIAAPKRGERWILITSAYHMPRSVGLFRAIDFPVEAYPVDWLTSGRSDLFTFFDRPLDALRRVDTGAREWIGMLTNRLTGTSKELFPAA